MSNQILIKRSTEAGKIPTSTDLAAGELGINLTDKKLYCGDGSAVFPISDFPAPYRDYLKGSMFPEYTVGEYYSNCFLGNEATNSTNGNSPSGRIDFYPFIVHKDIVIDQLGIGVRSELVGLEYKFAVYSDGADLTKVTETYTADASTSGLKLSTVSPTVTFYANSIYYFSLNCNQFNNSALYGFEPIIGTGAKHITNLSRIGTPLNRYWISHVYTDSFSASYTKSNLDFFDSANAFAINFPYLFFRVSSVL